MGGEVGGGSGAGGGWNVEKWCRKGCKAASLRYISFFFNDTATTEIYTLSLHDALPI